MKKWILLLALAISSSGFAAETGGLEIANILRLSQTETMTRRCVHDGGCRPGVEICVGGQCVPKRDEPRRCRANRECTPRQCVNGRCQ